MLARNNWHTASCTFLLLHVCLECGMRLCAWVWVEVCVCVCVFDLPKYSMHGTSCRLYRQLAQPR